MRAAGVRVAAALPIGNPLLRPFRGRIDLRNHRKIVVIDDRITYCGSQNCADPEFRVKAKYAPWVDAVMRFEGPIARQNQHLFASDWMTHVDEDIDELLRRPLPPADAGWRARAGDRHRADGALLGHAGDVRIADLRRAARARHHDPLLRARRVAAERAVLLGLPRRRHDDHLSGAERLVDRRRGQPQLLRRSARRRREDLRIRGRPAAHQVADARRRGHA